MSLPVAVHATIITVTTTNDSGLGSLRDALASAANGDTIDASSVTGTVLLTSGELVVTNSVDIIGPGPDLLAINGNPRFRGIFQSRRVFHISTNTVVSISHLTITNGIVLGNGGGIWNDHATLTIDNVVLSGNRADTDALGGGIYNDHADLTVNDCALRGNYAYDGGGAIYNDGFGGTSSVRISNSTLNGNSTRGDGGGINNNASSGGNASIRIVGSTLSSNSGGGIANTGAYGGSGSVQIASSTVSSNKAGSFGGGIGSFANRGFSSVEIASSTVSSNIAVRWGGGIGSASLDGGFARVEIDNSALSGNSTKGDGGGIYNEALAGGDSSLEIRNSTLNGNSASSGNGIYNYSGFFGGATAAVQIVNSTLSGNSVTNTQFGSAFYNFGDSFAGQGGGAILQIVNSTLSGNSATNLSLDSGIYNVAHAPSTAIVTIGSTILDVGVSGVNVTNDSGTLISLGYNLSSDDGGGFLTAPGDQINTDPMLEPLQDNGGLTLTHALLPRSPAIDAGDPNFTPPPEFDQRGPGFSRVVCGRIDIGAFEVQQCSPAEEIGDLIALVQSLGLPSGTANSLIVKLQAAASALGRGNTRTACGGIGAFLNEVNAQNGKRLTAAQAELLIADAMRIRAVLGC